MNHDETNRSHDAEWADLEPAEQARQLFADSLLERLHQGADPALQDKLRSAFDRLEESAPADNVLSFTRGFGRQLAAAASLIVGLGVLLFLIGGPGASSAEAMLERARANAADGGLRSFEILREWPSLNAEKRIGLLHLGDSGEYSVVIEGDYGPCRMGRRGGEHWKHGPMERLGGRGGERNGGEHAERTKPERSDRPERGERPGGRGPGGDSRAPLTDWLDTNGVELPYATLEEMVGLFDEGYTLEVVSVRTSDGDVRERLMAVAQGETDDGFPPRPDRIELLLGRAETGIEELRLHWDHAPRSSRRSGEFGRRHKGERDANEDKERGGERRSPWGSKSPEEMREFLSKRHPEWLSPEGEFDPERFEQQKFAGLKEHLSLSDDVTYEQFKEADRERSIVLRLLDEAPSAEVFEPVELEAATSER